MAALQVKKKNWVAFTQNTSQWNQQGSTFTRLSFCRCVYFDWNICVPHKTNQRGKIMREKNILWDRLLFPLPGDVWDWDFKNSVRKMLLNCLCRKCGKMFIFCGVLCFALNKTQTWCECWGLRNSEKRCTFARTLRRLASTLKFPWSLKVLQ